MLDEALWEAFDMAIEEETNESAEAERLVTQSPADKQSERITESRRIRSAYNRMMMRGALGGFLVFCAYATVNLAETHHTPGADPTTHAHTRSTTRAAAVMAPTEAIETIDATAESLSSSCAEYSGDLTAADTAEACASYDAVLCAANCLPDATCAPPRRFRGEKPNGGYSAFGRDPAPL